MIHARFLIDFFLPETTFIAFIWPIVLWRYGDPVRGNTVRGTLGEAHTHIM